MSFKLIVTLGPSILDPETIRQIHATGPCIFRINGSHSGIDEIRKTIDFVKSLDGDIKVMVDLPGNKIRTSNTFTRRRFDEGDILTLQPEDLNFPDFYKFLNVDDVLYTNDSLNSLTVQSIERKDRIVVLKARDAGSLVRNKGIHIRARTIDLPFLLEKDRCIIKLANEVSVDYLALSFVRTAEDIRQVRTLLTNDNVDIIAKVEKKEAVDNIDTILDEVDTILIDRVDLSNDIGMVQLPHCQDFVIRKAKARQKPVYLATQFLKYMEHNSIPLIAEVMGLYNDISEGVAGIQLSEETAIGKYPTECIKLIFDMHRQVLTHNRKGRTVV